MVKSRKRLVDSEEHKQFVAEISAVMKKYPRVSKGVLLARMRNRTKLAKLVEDDDDCKNSAFDPVRNEWYCLDPK
jgi:hypothetical protein